MQALMPAVKSVWGIFFFCQAEARRSEESYKICMGVWRARVVNICQGKVIGGNDETGV